MTTQEELLAALRGRFGDSQTAIAEAMGISLARLNNYVRGVRSMDDEAVIACCELLNWNAQKYVAKHRAENAKTKRERSFWQRVATAATLALFVALPFANPALAYTEPAHSASRTMHYAKLWAGLGRWIVRLALGLIRGRQPPALLA